MMRIVELIVKHRAPVRSGGQPLEMHSLIGARRRVDRTVANRHCVCDAPHRFLIRISRPNNSKAPSRSGAIAEIISTEFDIDIIATEGSLNLSSAKLRNSCRRGLTD